MQVSPGLANDGMPQGFSTPPARKQVISIPEGVAEPVIVDAQQYKTLARAVEDLKVARGGGGGGVVRWGVHGPECCLALLRMHASAGRCTPL